MNHPEIVGKSLGPAENGSVHYLCGNPILLCQVDTDLHALPAVLRAGGHQCRQMVNVFGTGLPAIRKGSDSSELEEEAG